MKNFKFKKPILTTLVIFMLLFPGCGGEFISVNQPCTADPFSFFEVQISVSASGGDYGGDGYFGILMPDGWTTNDSIMYIKTPSNDTAYVNFSDSLTQQMSLVDPPPENYHWWVGLSFVGEGEWEFIIDLIIFTDNQTGYFYIDYMLGDSINGLNYKRSNDHLIIAGEVTGCFPEGLFLSNQEEIDNFQANNPGCTSLAGHVTISGENITNLDGLDSITFIGGSLKIIDNPSLSVLTGLSHLDSIKGSLYIAYNDGLTAISGLSHLAYLGRDLRIENDSLLTTIGSTSFESLNTLGRDLKIKNNSSLANMPGLIHLSFIAGDLEINQNHNLINLTGLNNLAFIGDDLQVLNNISLTNLTGLENLTFIDGDITISQNPNLTSLTGLNNMASIDGNLDLNTNYSLLSLSALENLILIGGYLTIGNNHNLTSLSGLENLVSIGGGLQIIQNNALTSLSALENLILIGGYLTIENNNNLTSLSGLENLVSIGGGLQIIQNNALTSLSGIDNIEANSIVFLHISNNLSLSTCDVQSVCEYLAAPNGTINISSNAPGCNNIAEVVAACAACPLYGITFSTQEQIDSFPVNYPECSNIEGRVEITGNDINNLYGLNMLTSIGGDLWIWNNDSLASLAGLENLISIGGNFEIYNNPSLTGLSGLENLSSIGGNLIIALNSSLVSLALMGSLCSIGNNFRVYDNNVLTSISGLESLTSIGGGVKIWGNDAMVSMAGLQTVSSIGGDLEIYHNNSLTSLAGLENIDAVSINNLMMYYNSSLSACAVQSICDYLAAPNGTVTIEINAPGCNRPEEVEQACETIGIPDIGTEMPSGDQQNWNVNVFPNPGSGIITVEFEMQEVGYVIVAIFNLTGQQVAEPLNELKSPGQQQVQFDVSGLPPGVFYCRLKAGNRTTTKKIMITE